MSLYTSKVRPKSTPLIYKNIYSGPEAARFQLSSLRHAFASNVFNIFERLFLTYISIHVDTLRYTQMRCYKTTKVNSKSHCSLADYISMAVLRSVPPAFHFPNFGIFSLLSFPQTILETFRFDEYGLTLLGDVL